MADLPIINAALQVEAIGFRHWQNHWVGVLITPWFMSAVALPVERAHDGGQHTAAPLLPAGEIEFTPAHEASIGDYFSASLFSPMGQFTTQDEARSVAEQVLSELFAPPVQTTVESLPAGITARLERPLSRRGFLTALLPTDKRS